MRRGRWSITCRALPANKTRRGVGTRVLAGAPANHPVLIRDECTEASANPVPQRQAKSHTRRPPSKDWGGASHAVAIRTAQAIMPLTEEARYRVGDAPRPRVFAQNQQHTRLELQ
jgi:hypothetical protein